MIQVKVLTVLNNFGEEKFIVKRSRIEVWLFFFKTTHWDTVTHKKDNSPYFFDKIEDARAEARYILINSNYKGERITEILNVEEVTEL